RVLIALVAAALPLRADLGGITTTPANLPSPPNEMTVGGGYLWILTQAGNLGRMAPGGAYVEYPLQFGIDQNGIPNAAALAYGATDGNVWVSGFNGHIARITPAGTVTDFAALGGINEEANIVSGADGAMWFYDIPFFGATNDNNSKLARIDIYGQVTTYPLGLGRDFFGSLVTGGDGNLWFMDTAKNAIVKFSIVDHTVTTYALSPQNGGGKGVLGLDGNVWFTHGTAIDRVTADGTITEFKTPSGNQVSDIAVAGDGNIWFTEYDAGKLGQLVVSSISSGGSATINESAAVLKNGETLLLLPPGFVTVSGKKGLDTNTCPPLTFIVKITPPTAGVYVSTTILTSPCADIASDVTFFTELGSTAAAHTTGFVTVTNGGPNDAGFTTSVAQFTAPAGTVITNVQKSDSDVSIVYSGLKVTATKDSLPLGTHFWFAVEFSDRSALSGVDVSFSPTPDPKPSNNAAAGMFNGSAAVALQPDPGSIVAIPVTRGK
ncbi:MAG TPA: hypothetical protein VKU62_02670, partial [Thermoanaerobaculia bacterium]|nr:hypothetical protein [Thermoanaerobaculia bacterium]